MKFFAVFLLGTGSLLAQASGDARDALNRGVQAFKAARYPEAVTFFQRAVDLNPGEVTPRLYLATVYMQQYVPGLETTENVQFAQRAEGEFRNVLGLDGGNLTAMQSLASLALNRKLWGEATNWYRRVLAVQPNDKTAYYSLGFITWGQWYPAYAQARTKLGMRPETPGPIPDAGVRNALRAEWWSALEEGMFHLSRALEIDPQYDDAMAYLNLLIRERADLRETTAEYQQDVAAADQWVQKALATKQAKAGTMQPQAGVVAPPPPPPPPAGGTPQRIRISGNVQRAKLVRKVDPIYPPLAAQARIMGVVQMSAVIGRDGTVSNLQVTSGHPLLVPAALEAIKQWVYQPTLLNGEPVEVVTQIDLPFTLPN